MKKTIALILALLMCLSVFVSCTDTGNGNTTDGTTTGAGDTTTKDPNDTSPIPGNTTANNDDVSNDPEETFGGKLDDLGVNDGYFENQANDCEIKCVLGTQNAYTLNGNVLTFANITEDSVYSISGKFTGNIVIDVDPARKFDLELTGLSLVSTGENPIVVKNGDKVTITAKKDTENYIYDKRPAIDPTDLTLTSGAIYSEVDLQIGGKGTLSVVSDNNNGIHSKDDLEVKNLNLTVACQDNALKGNDSVEILNGTITLISKRGDGIKTTNSNISNKGNQRGTVSVSGANVTIYAACDGIDAAYNAVVDGETTKLNIYTDKYSSYSEEVTANSSSVYYIRYTSKFYKYSVKYSNSDSEFEWVNASEHSTVSGGKTSYYYFSFPKKENYSKLQVFVYTSEMEQGQETEYTAASELMGPNPTYDTFAISNRGGILSYNWTNYTTSTHGAPGMNDGNTDKGDHSTKGIKVVNEIIVNNGTVNVKSYDDAFHANSSSTLENGETPVGNITVNGGTVTLYSNDDGIHATGDVYLKGGNVNVINSYEGIEGNTVSVSGGNVSITAKDDGMNAVATTGTSISFKGGYVYICCSGDGVDTNSKSTYEGISFEGGDVVIISNSSGNSAIDTEKGYKYTAGSVVAIMPKGGMSNESTNCQNFSEVGSSSTMSLTAGATLTISGGMNKTITMPYTISNAFVVVLNKAVSVK